MKLVLILLTFSLSSQLLAASYVKIDTTLEEDLNESVKNIVSESLDPESREPGVEPTIQGMREDLVDLIFSLYKGGYVSTEEFETFKTEYDKLNNPTEPSSGWKDNDEHKDALLDIIGPFFSGQVAKFKSSPEKCVSYLGIANHGQCCSGLVLSRHSQYPFKGSCKPEAASCSKHSECCTGVCSGLEGSSDGKGVCEAAKSCFQEISTGQECGVDNPICKDRDSGAYCFEVNYNSSNANTCTANGNSCKASSECCSDNCKSGKCEEISRCQKCSKSGEKPTKAEPCCPGLYEGMNGKCIQDWPPFILPTSSIDRVKSILNIIASNLFINSAWAYVEPTNSASNSGGGSSSSSSSSSTSSNDKNACIAPCTHISHLPKSERKEIEDAQSNCIQMNKEDQSKISSCLEGVKDQEYSMYAKHRSEGTIKKSDGIVDMENYVDEYNIPYVTATGLSDVKSCRFNSLKDDWNDASNMEKNAEVTLRAFEFVYTGNGDDWWKQAGKSDNIFKRVKDIATKLRHNRADYLNSLRSNDVTMACLCIAAFGGISKFPERTNFYNNECLTNTDIVSEIATLGIQDNGGNNVDGSDGSASNTDQANSLDNLNQGSTGISHEKLLVNWLEKRTAVQMQRFTDNAELEEEMQETIEYVRSEPWLDPASNEKKEEFLYDYAVKWTASWIKIVIVVIVVIVAVVLTVVTMGGFAAIAGAITAISVSASTVALAAALVVVGSYFVASAIFKDPELAPGKHDVQIADNKKWNGLGTTKFDGFKRYMTHTRSKYCQTNAPTSMCIKNFYASPTTDLNKKEFYYLIDIQSPLFMNPNKITYKMNVAGPNNSALNLAFDKALNLAKKTHPSDYKDSSRWKGYYIKKSKGFQDRDIYSEYFYNDSGDVKYNNNKNGWYPLMMAFAPKLEIINFDEDYKKAFINAAKDYAKCYNLKKCLTEAGLATGNNSQGGTAVSNEVATLTNDDIGFKLFFADGVSEQINEGEVEAFAEYAYQLHYLWPNSSELNSISYPLPGMVPYFEAILYNIKLLGSLNADRGNRYAEAWQAYEADWQKRFSDYNVNAGEVGLGEKSKNAKFGKNFFAKFQTLDLTGGGNIAAYQNMLDGAIKSGDYSSAELQALKAGTSKAIRAAEDKKRYAHYQNTVGKTDRGKNTLKKAKDFMNSFNSPIDTFPQVANSRFGGSGNSNASQATTSSKSESETRPSVAAYTPQEFSMPDYSSYSSGSSSSKSGSDQLNQDVSNAEVEHMIMSSEKDKSLYEENSDDTLFTKVSKAYKRNLDRVLVRKNDLAVNSKVLEAAPSTHSDISKEDKESLKNLLDNN